MPEQTATQLILASGSPRRRQLMAQLGVSFEVFSKPIDERPALDESIDCYVRRMAREKAIAARQAWAGPPLPVLGADTIVVVDNRILGKPGSVPRAVEMLRSLSGRSHQVISALAIIAPDGTQADIRNVTDVSFRPLSDSEIGNYCATAEPLDKAGGYAIQGLAASFIRAIKGSYSGVMGLPLFETAELLSRVGVVTPLGLNQPADSDC